MGTTATALQQAGARYCYVLAIEGYSYLLTDHISTSAVVIAWSGSEWSQALPGLKVGGPIARVIKPWQTELDVPILRLSVMPDANDTFGKAVFRAKGTYNTRLTDTFLPATDGSGTINVKSTAGFGSAGEVFVGKTKHTYASKSGGAFTLSATGANSHSPFTAGSGNHYAGPATHPANQNFDVSGSPRVSDVAPAWIGRKVALYIHRISGTVLDVRAQAKLEFAGVIRDIEDSEDGSTVLECEDMLCLARDAVLLKDQWIGYVKPGIRLVAGTLFGLNYNDFTGSGTGSTSAANYLTVVTSGAVGTAQINEGVYELGEFLSLLDSWLAADVNLTAHRFRCSTKPTDAGIRTFIECTTSDYSASFYLLCSHLAPLEFLGFRSDMGGSGFRHFEPNDADWSSVGIEGPNAYAAGTGDLQLVSDVAPYRIKFLQKRKSSQASIQEVVVTLETAADGVFFDQTDFLETIFKAFIDAGGGDEWGVFSVGNGIYLGRRDDATHISHLTQYIGPLKYLDAADDDLADGISMDDDGDNLPVRQVVLLSGTFASIVTKLMASLGGTPGVNHADYDVLQWGAGIPWSLLGDNWVNSATALEHDVNSRSITTLLTEPTRILDLIVPELALRLAWIVWKDEGYQLRTLATPSSLTADWTLDETNKAESIGTQSAGRTVTAVTNEYLRNVAKIEYARDAKGKYHRTLTAMDQNSITEFGESKAVTIQAISSYGRESSTAAQVEELATSLISRVFPKFAKPLKTLRRSIAPTLFGIAPGDTVSVSDDFARDPTAGTRSMSNRAGTVLSVKYDRGHEGGQLFGEVEVMLSDEDRHYPMSSAAEIDATYSGTVSGRTYTNGYAATAAGGPAILLKAHAYSRSSDTADVNRFAVSDVVRIVRLDKSGGDAWSRTVNSVVAADNVLLLSADLAAPAFTAGATERYRIQPREYSACVASQKLRAFQADDADGYIEDLAEPNTYGEQDWQTFAGATLTDLPILPVSAEYWGDGKPFHPGLLYDAALFNNNLPNYRTAPNAPVMLQSPNTTNSVAIYVPVLCFFFYLGPSVGQGLVRKLKVAPFLKTTNAANTATVRVTSSLLPPRADLANGALSYTGATQSATFTSASTSFAEATEQSIVPVRGNGAADGTWITVELKASNASYLSECYGLSRLYLGPAEVY